MTDHQAALRDFRPKHSFFVGIDSDGCVFDSMELKHKECFIPNIIQHYELQAVSKYARQVAEFVNLYSRHRGVNRFPGLVLTHQLLAERPETAQRGVELKSMTALDEFVKSGKPMGNPALEEELRRTRSPDLALALTWSKAVNASVNAMVSNVRPFPYFRRCVERLAGCADLMCVSSTPVEALTKEWQENDIDKYVALIAGQETGSKKEVLHVAAQAGYGKDKILMIGDAPGDMKAARANDALFYPIIPGMEEASWEKLYTEAIDRFQSGAYAGDYEAALVEKFLAKLPETPSWSTKKS